MSFGEFLKDRILMLVLQGICMTGLYGFLRLTGYGRGNIRNISKAGFTKSRHPLQGFLLSVKMEEARKILRVEAFGKSLLRIRKLKIMWIWFFIMHVRKMFIRTI